MKKQNNNTLQILISLAVIAVLSSCGNSKSNEANQNNLSSTTPITVNAEKPLANCNKSANADISMNINAVLDNAGNADLNWTKIRFNFLSTTATAAGNTVRFFKWKVSGGQSTLDQTPLQTMFFNLSNSQPTTNLTNTIPVNEISSSRGVFVQLNDSVGAYQVIKAVIYDSNGKIVAQLNSLIPQFSSKVADYTTNADGTARAQLLIDMHPLKAVATSTWSQSDYNNFYQNLCF